MRQGDTETATSIIPSSCSSTEALGTSGLAQRRHQGFPLSSQGPPEGPPQARHPWRGSEVGKFPAGGGGRPGRGSTKAARPRSQRPRSSSRPFTRCSAQKERRRVDPQPSRKQPGEGLARPLWISLRRDGLKGGLHLLFYPCLLQPAPRPPSPGPNGKRERPEGRCSGQIRRERAPSLTSTGGGKRRGSDRSTADPLLPCSYRSYRG